MRPVGPAPTAAGVDLGRHVRLVERVLRDVAVDFAPGPVIADPIRSAAQVARLRELDPAVAVPYVLEILRRLDDAGIGIADFQLRRPTLDDVFLTLTGPTADQGGNK